MSAGLATVRDHESVGHELDGYRPHQTSAFLCPVSRINVHMPAPNTYRAMIGISVTDHVGTTVTAGKILFFPYEPHRLLFTQAQHQLPVGIGEYG